MKEKPDNLVYHSLHRRHLNGGCMPLFLLLAVGLLAGVFALVQVEMKPPLRPAGVGDVLYRKDDMLETQIRQRSPLPMRLPRYIAPLRQDEGVVNLPLRRVLKAAEAPEELPYPAAVDSVVLNRVVLLELPPARSDAGKDTPSAQEAKPAAPEATPSVAPVPATPAYAEPASAALQGKEVA